MGAVGVSTQYPPGFERKFPFSSLFSTSSAILDGIPRNNRLFLVTAKNIVVAALLCPHQTC
jgi:hypothetical protein